LEVRAELKFIGYRSSILGTIIIPSLKLRAKNDINEPKILKIARQLRCFWGHFRIYSLKIFETGGLGGWGIAPSSPPPVYAVGYIRQYRSVFEIT